MWWVGRLANLQIAVVTRNLNYPWSKPELCWAPLGSPNYFASVHVLHHLLHLPRDAKHEGFYKAKLKIVWQFVRVKYMNSTCLKKNIYKYHQISRDIFTHPWGWALFKRVYKTKLCPSPCLEFLGTLDCGLLNPTLNMNFAPPPFFTFFPSRTLVARQLLRRFGDDPAFCWRFHILSILSILSIDRLRIFLKLLLFLPLFTPNCCAPGKPQKAWKVMKGHMLETITGVPFDLSTHPSQIILNWYFKFWCILWFDLWLSNRSGFMKCKTNLTP